MNKELCDPREDSSSFRMTSLLSCVPYQIPWSCVAIHVLHAEVMKIDVFLTLSKWAFVILSDINGFVRSFGTCSRELDTFFFCLKEFSNAEIRTKKSSEDGRMFRGISEYSRPSQTLRLYGSRPRKNLSPILEVSNDPM